MLYAHDNVLIHHYQGCWTLSETVHFMPSPISISTAHVKYLEDVIVMYEEKQL